MKLTRLMWCDYRATLRERKVKLLAAMFAYAILAMPFVLANPPAHVKEAIAIWLDAGDPFGTFMFAWIDLAMNKSIAFIPAVLAGGVVLRERDTRQLPIFASKPVAIEDYFLVRAISCCGVMATLYLTTHAIGAVYFAFTVQGFNVAPFIIAVTPNFFAAMFATAFVAAIAMVTRRRALSVMTSMLALFALVGLALVGLVNPAWRRLSLLNPFSLGVEGLRHLDQLRPVAFVGVCGALVLETFVMLWIGKRLSRGLKEAAT